jgi:selenocysteine lyase/cysteine desulfurase
LLEFFRADPDVYVAVFTANASHALKLVGESYPFRKGDAFVLTYDNHNSVNGIREYDRARGAETRYVPMLPPELRVREADLAARLESAAGADRKLLAFPAQSNFSGVQHPLEWVALARGLGFDVLLDAAAFVPTNRLDLSGVSPDFVALSFYKMFGYPTGVGALLARKDALARLHRPWFAGGTIEVASVQADRFVLAAGSAGFEDGTLDFLGIPAVELGLDLVASVGIDTVHERVRMLTGWLIGEMLALRHRNGAPLVRLYGPAVTEMRGGTLAFNLFDAGGGVVDQRQVEARAAQRRISLRTGCFCNPGAGELALGLTRGEIQACLGDEARMSYDEFRLCVDPKTAGAVRVSLGIASTFSDAYALVSFLKEFL